MKLETPELMLILFLAVVVVGLYLAAMRYMMGVNKRIRQADAQIALLIKLAEKAGVTKDELEVIKNVYNRP